jgi:hypothetical protein
MTSSQSSAVLGVKPCGCISFIDLSPLNMEIAKMQAARHGRTVELVPHNEALSRWRSQDTFDCSVCGISD